MAKEQMTPMMTQYLKTKEEYEDCILFYRLGDFYEMFFDDAIKASKELEITLTGRLRTFGTRTNVWRSFSQCVGLYCKAD